MRSKLFLMSVGLAVGACGGGDSKPKLPDAKVFMDAAIDAAPMCAVQCDNPAFCGMNMGTSTFPMLQIGSATMNPPGRISDDWFFTPMMGPLMGRKIFDITAGVSPQGTTTPDIYVMRVVKPQAGNFPLNTAINLDPDPNAMTPVAFSFWFGDAVIQNQMLADVGMFYWASNGSVTLTAIGENDGSPIDGMQAATNYREVNEMTGADVPGGCTVTWGGFRWALTQMSSGGGAFQEQNAAASTPGIRPLTQDEKIAVSRYIDEFLAKRGIQY